MNIPSSVMTEAGVLLTQARVLDVEGASLKLQAGELVFGATPALAFPYRPQVGDLVLAIRQGDDAWVIGVIEGSGVTSFSAPADLELRAPRGRIRLAARDAIEIKADEVVVNARRSQTTAEVITQQAESLETTVKGLALLRAGEARTDVEQASTLRAERIHQLARKEVKIDGDLINLG